MKKIFMFMGALALTFAMVSCNKENTGKDVDNIVEDGFYVKGAAVAMTELDVKYQLAPGKNEVDQSLRDGMYEKYIYIEKNKDFELVLLQGASKVRYGATLSDFDASELADNPTVILKRGDLQIGESAPAMQVAETGLYHIVLDLNLKSDLSSAQIVVAPVEWGVSGGMNGWGYTALTVKNASATEIQYELTNQELAANGEFKFKYGNGWKIQLDADGLVKANTNLGDAMVPGGNNIKVEKAGKYTVTLTYNLAKGDIANSYKYSVVCTEESSMPTTMNIIGNDFGNWDWSAASVVEMVPVHSHSGMFWAVRYMTTDTEFKFCAKKEWNGDFCTLTNNEGFTTPGNNKVDAAGLYTIIVDLVGEKVTVKPAAIYGMGDCFGGWDEGTHPFTIGADGTATVTIANAGNVRMYADINNAGNWWQSEFNVFDGAIVYRADGGDQAAVAATAGQTVTLNFNAGTGSIQ